MPPAVATAALIAAEARALHEVGHPVIAEALALFLAGADFGPGPWQRLAGLSPLRSPATGARGAPGGVAGHGWLRGWAALLNTTHQYPSICGF